MHLTLHLTARCNLRCRYCYADPHEGGDMTFETARAAIDVALADPAHRSRKKALGVVFFGGEPLLRRDLIRQVIRHCQELEQRDGRSFYYKITTNGTLLDEAFLTEPDTCEVFVALSHDGVAAAHDTNRVDAAGAGSFERVDRAAGLLLQHRPYAPAMLVVGPNTVAHYADSVAYLFDRGFHYLICSLNYGAEWTEADLAELERQYHRIAGWYYDRTLAEDKFYFSPFEVKIASHVYPGSCKADRCELGKTQISVAPNGRLYPCVQFVGDGTDTTYSIGHVDTGIDPSARERLYRINAREKAACARCAIRERCNHYCGCLNKQATGHVNRVSPLQCAHERLIMPIADGLAERLYRKRSAMFIQKHYNELYPVISLVEDAARRPEAE